MAQKKSVYFDDSFYKLAGEVTRVLEKNKDGTVQQEQVETLLDAERKFRDTVLKYRQATEIYKKFLQKICIQNKNILSARPYFRAVAKDFSEKITPAIKTSDVAILQTFDINYQFITFIKKSWLGPFPKRAEQLYNRVHRARTLLIENNIPLAINRAKLFYRKTPKSHLSLLDFINICVMGLAAGVDKWCGAYSPIFRSVCIGRMTGNLIENYSETMLHFYPSDKKILYKANSIRGRQGLHDMEELADAINKSFAEDAKEGKSVPKDPVDANQLGFLMSAASLVSSDSIVGEDGCGIYQYTPDPAQDAETSYIEKETATKMVSLAKNLSVVQRKILKLKGIKL